MDELAMTNPEIRALKDALRDTVSQRDTNRRISEHHRKLLEKKIVQVMALRDERDFHRNISRFYLGVIRCLLQERSN